MDALNNPWEPIQRRAEAAMKLLMPPEYKIKLALAKKKLRDEMAELNRVNRKCTSDVRLLEKALKGMRRDSTKQLKEFAKTEMEKIRSSSEWQVMKTQHKRVQLTDARLKKLLALSIVQPTKMSERLQRQRRKRRSRRINLSDVKSKLRRSLRLNVGTYSDRTFRV